MKMNKGDMSASRIIFLAIKIVIGLAVMIFVANQVIGIETGCSRHDENPAACIRDVGCRPYPFFTGGRYGEDIVCVASVRTPDNMFNAVEDDDCFCPDDYGYQEVLDGGSEYYGMCVNDNDNIITCTYTDDYPYPFPEEVEKCNGRNHGEIWLDDDDEPVKCCDGTPGTGGDVMVCDEDSVEERCVQARCYKDVEHVTHEVIDTYLAYQIDYLTLTPPGHGIGSYIFGEDEYYRWAPLYR